MGKFIKELQIKKAKNGYVAYKYWDNQEIWVARTEKELIALVEQLFAEGE